MRQDRWQKRSGLVLEIIDGEFLILDPESNQLFRLNRVGGRIWELCDKTSAETIAETTSQEFKVSVTEALDDVRGYLEQLGKAGLVVRIEPEASPEAKICSQKEDR